MVALGDASQAVRSEGEEMLCQKLAQQWQRRLIAFCRSMQQVSDKRELKADVIVRLIGRTLKHKAAALVHCANFQRLRHTLS